MMDIICYLEKEKLGTSSDEGVLPALINLWLLARLRKSGFPVEGFMVFLYLGDQKDGKAKKKLAEAGITEAVLWESEKPGALLLVNQKGNIWIHHNLDMKNYKPASREVVTETVRFLMEEEEGR